MGADFIIRLGLNTTTFTAGADKAKADLKSIDDAVGKIVGAKSAILSAVAGTAIGGIALSAFNKAEAKLDELIQKAKDIKIGSVETGLDSTRYQQVSNVLESKGSSPEKLKSSIEHVAEAMTKIRDGEDDGAKLQTAMARLGITMDDIKKKNHGQVWLEIAENMKSAEITTEKLAAMKEIFGKNPAELIPAFREGFDGRVANRNVIDDKTQKDLETIRTQRASTSAGAALVGNEIKNHSATLLGQAMAGFSTAFLDPVNTILGNETTQSDENAKSQSAKLESRNEEKAKREAKVAADKKQREEVDKKRKEILKRIEEEQKKSAEEEVKSAKPSVRRRILLARDQAIDQQLSAIDSDIQYNGDETGEKALKRLKLVDQRSENRREIKEIDKSIKGVSLLPQNVDSRARIGLFTGRPDSNVQIMQRQLSTMERQLTAQQQSVRELQQLRQTIEE